MPEPPQKPKQKKILEKSKTKIQGFGQFQTHPETKRKKEKTNKQTSKQTSLKCLSHLNAHPNHQEIKRQRQSSHEFTQP